MSPVRPLTSLATLLLALLASAPASAIDFTSTCNGTITSTDRAAVVAAAAFLDEHRRDIWKEVKRDRNGANTYSYSSINESTYDDWSAEVDALLSGSVKIACFYNGSILNRCTDTAPSDGTMGYTESFTDTHADVVLCFDNMRTFVNAPPVGSLTALLIGTTAHELMHHVDGWEDHGAGGTTNPNNPDTAAETIGVAAENLALSGQLQPYRDAYSVTSSGDAIDVTLDWSVGNENPLAGLGLMGSATAGPDRNPGFATCLLVDGSRASLQNLAAVAGSTNVTGTPFNLTLDGYRPGYPTRTVSVFADCNAALSEWDEDDNTTSLTINSEVDIAIDVALAARPEFHSAMVSDVEVPGWYHWYTLTYAATVTNLDSEMPAPSFDVQLLYDDMWTGDAYAERATTVSGLAAGGQTTITWTVDVPTDAAGSGPTWAIDTYWIADWDAESLHDPDRSNNTAHITIDADYWKPDYRIVSVEAGGTFDPSLPSLPLFGGGSSGSGSPIPRTLYVATVRNEGPVDATVASLLQTTSSDGTTRNVSVPALAVLAEDSTTAFLLAELACGQQTYDLMADGTDLIDENDEDDNALRVTVGEACPDLTRLDLHPDIQMPLIIDDTAWIDDAIARNLVEVEYWAEWATHFVDWLLASQSNGPFLPVDWLTRWDHVVRLQPDLHFVVWSTPRAGVHYADATRWAETTEVVQTVRGAQLAGEMHPLFEPFAAQLGQTLASHDFSRHEPLACSTAIQPLLQMTKLSSLEGRQILQIAAAIDLPISAEVLLTKGGDGLRLVVTDHGGSQVLSARLPAGRYDPRSRTGWRANRAGTVLTWKGEVANGTEFTVTLKHDARTGLTAIKLLGRGLALGATSEQLPLAAHLHTTGRGGGACATLAFEAETGAGCTIASSSSVQCRSGPSAR